MPFLKKNFAQFVNIQSCKNMQIEYWTAADVVEEGCSVNTFSVSRIMVRVRFAEEH